jgi:hypothetical protein
MLSMLKNLRLLLPNRFSWRLIQFGYQYFC